MGLRIIFLDVDGVLNLMGSGRTTTLNKKRLHLLRLLVENTGAKIVVSSTWRIDPEYLGVLRRNLAYRGLTIYSKTPWYTGSDWEHARGIEISIWMQRHKEYIQEFVILDDIDNFFPYQKHNLFLCDPQKGLTLEIVQSAIDFLTRKEKR